MLPPEMLQQSFSRIFNHVQHQLESSASPEIWVGNFALRMMRGKLQKQPQMAWRIRRPQLPQNGQIGIVHRQDIMKPVKVVHLDLSSA